jgi:hypothetical protein
MNGMFKRCFLEEVIFARSDWRVTVAWGFIGLALAVLTVLSV